jgi:hypothetical protein
MTTLTKQMVHAYWHILEDYPTKDGDYVVVFETSDGSLGWPEVWEYTSMDGWQPIGANASGEQPTHWCNLPMPK